MKDLKEQLADRKLAEEIKKKAESLDEQSVQIVKQEIKNDQGK